MEFTEIKPETYYLGLCKLSPEQKSLVNKNPHCAEFFCNLSNILNCTQCIKKIKKFKTNYKFKNQRQELFKQPTIKMVGQISCDKCSNGLLYELMTADYEKKVESKIDKYKIMKNFTQEQFYYLYSDLPNIMKYEGTSPKPKTVIHWGQLKMFLVILLFLVNKISQSDNDEYHIIYPGSARGDTILILCEMFPNTRWYLVDPNPFHPDLYKHKQVLETRNEYFTDKLAQYYSDKFGQPQNRKHKLFFISDIREETSDELVKRDQTLNAGWHKIIKPDYSYLKFRCPYEGDTFYTYYDGPIYIQPYAPLASCETRLLLSTELKEKVYDIHEFQSKFNYFNRVLRPGYYTKSIIHDDSNYFDHCYDCTYFSYLMKNYIDKFGKQSPFKSKDILKIMKEITNKIAGMTIDRIDYFNKLVRENNH